MNIVLIGAGNLATNLGKALLKAGHSVSQVYSRTWESASMLAEQLGSEALTDISRVTKDADLYVLSVKDSALESLIGALCDGERRGVFVHTAGSMPMSVFSGKAERYGVVYPMQSFTKSRAVDFSEIPVFLEASDDGVAEMLGALSGQLSSSVRFITSAERKKLHLAAVFACNFVNHCYELSAEVLASCGLPFSVMLPLIDETAAKVHQLSPREAQTGPAVRYDENVISMQSASLAREKRLQDIYLLMSKSIHDVAIGNS